MSDPEKVPIQISRRHFIFGAGATALLSAAFAGVRHLGRYPIESIPLVSISNKAAAIYRKAGRILIPETDWLPGHGGDDETLRRIDAFLKGVPEGATWKIAALPLVFEHGTALDRFGSKRLTKLSNDDAHDYMKRWSESNSLTKAQLLVALRTMYSFSYFERDDVLRAMGRKPHCVNT